MYTQPLTPLGEKRKGKHEINVSTADIDERQHSPGYYKQTEAAAAFRQARQLCLLISQCNSDPEVELAVQPFQYSTASCFKIAGKGRTFQAYLQSGGFGLQDWESAKVRQDKALDNIEKGLGVLKGLGQAMGDNLNQQDVLLTEIDSKVYHCACVFAESLRVTMRMLQSRITKPSAFADGGGIKKSEDKQHEAKRPGHTGQSVSYSLKTCYVLCLPGVLLHDVL